MPSVIKGKDRYFEFTPASDISSWELAQLLSKLSYLNGTICDSPDKRIPEEFMRHFTRVAQP
jgi:hypothetical protein